MTLDRVQKCKNEDEFNCFIKHYVQANKTPVFSGIAVFMSTYKEVTPLLSGCLLDSFVNCSLFSFCDKARLRHLYLCAVVFSAASNNKKDLLQMKILKAIIHSCLNNRVDNYCQFGSLEPADAFYALIKAWVNFTEGEEVICEGASVYKCTFDFEDALEFCIENNITEYDGLLHVYRNIYRGRWLSPTVDIPENVLRAQANNAAAVCQGSARRKLLTDLCADAAGQLKQQERAVPRLMYIIDFLAMHEQCCIWPVRSMTLLR